MNATPDPKNPPPFPPPQAPQPLSLIPQFVLMAEADALALQQRVAAAEARAQAAERLLTEVKETLITAHPSKAGVTLDRLIALLDIR